MTTCLLTRAVLRVWGFFLIVSVLASTPEAVVAVFGWAREETGQYFSLVTVISFLSSLFLGLVMLIYADRLARWLFPQEERLRFSLDADHLQRLLFAVLGMYFVVGGITGVAVALDVALRRPDWIQDPMMSYVNHRQGLVAALVQLVAGSFLVFGKEGVSRLWRTIHPMGRSSENSPEV